MDRLGKLVPIGRCAAHVGDVVNEEGERVELFGALELVLSETNFTGYKDTFFLKGRKKKPYQAKIWRPERKDHINLGTFPSAHAAAVEVAQYRRYGREHQRSPDKSRAESSTPPPTRLPATFPLPLTRCYLVILVCTEKQKLVAATTIDASTPPIFQGDENSSVQLPVAEVRPCVPAASAHAFATGAVAVALPAQPYAPPQPISGHALGLLQHGGRLIGP